MILDGKINKIQRIRWFQISTTTEKLILDNGWNKMDGKLVGHS